MPNLTQTVDEYVRSPTQEEYLRLMRDLFVYRPTRFQPLTPYTSLPSDTPNVASIMDETVRVGDYVERSSDLSGEFWILNKPSGEGPYKVVGFDYWGSFILEGGRNVKFSRNCFRKVDCHKPKTSRKLSGFGRFNKSLNEKGM